MIERNQAHILQYGYGFWAVEIPGVTPFAGFVGLRKVPFQARYYSVRSAMRGSTREAIQAGIKQANIATNARTRDAAASATGSVGATSNKTLLIICAAATEPASPNNSPVTTSLIP